MWTSLSAFESFKTSVVAARAPQTASMKRGGIKFTAISARKLIAMIAPNTAPRAFRSLNNQFQPSRRPKVSTTCAGQLFTIICFVVHLFSPFVHLCPCSSPSSFRCAYFNPDRTRCSYRDGSFFLLQCFSTDSRYPLYTMKKMGLCAFCIYRKTRTMISYLTPQQDSKGPLILQSHQKGASSSRFSSSSTLRPTVRLKRGYLCGSCGTCNAFSIPWPLLLHASDMMRS